MEACLKGYGNRGIININEEAKYAGVNCVELQIILAPFITRNSLGRSDKPSE